MSPLDTFSLSAAVDDAASSMAYMRHGVVYTISLNGEKNSDGFQRESSHVRLNVSIYRRNSSFIYAGCTTN